MRTFIKSHRRSSSLEACPPKTTPKRNSTGSPTELQPPVFPPSAPRQSSSFESLQKLTSGKLFSTKLFKKSGAQKLPATPDLPAFPRGYDSRSPSCEWRALGTEVALEDIPAIKGTRTHEWGENSDVSNSVIVLNRNSISSDGSYVETRDEQSPWRLARRSLDSATQTLSSTEEYSGPEIRIRSSTPHKLREASDSFLKKRWNRQARIHSKADIAKLEGSFPMPVEAISPPFARRRSSERSQCLGASGTMEQQLNPVNPEKCSLYAACSERSQSLTKATHALVATASTEVGLQNNLNSASVELRDDLENERESLSEEDSGSSFSDDSSKFSFEVGGGINGRTSSVKYYSKPDPPMRNYIDDLFEDEDFDEDMNCYDDDQEYEEDTEHLFGASHVQLEHGYSMMHEVTDSDSEQETKSNISSVLSKGQNAIFPSSDGRFVLNSGDSNGGSNQENIGVKMLEKSISNIGLEDVEDVEDDSDGIIPTDTQEDIDSPVHSQPSHANFSHIKKYSDIFGISDSDEDTANNSSSQYPFEEGYYSSDEEPTLRAEPAANTEDGFTDALKASFKQDESSHSSTDSIDKTPTFALDTDGEYFPPTLTLNKKSEVDDLDVSEEAAPESISLSTSDLEQPADAKQDRANIISSSIMDYAIHEVATTESVESDENQTTCVPQTTRVPSKVTKYADLFNLSDENDEDGSDGEFLDDMGFNELESTPVESKKPNIPPRRLGNEYFGNFHSPVASSHNAPAVPRQHSPLSAKVILPATENTSIKSQYAVPRMGQSPLPPPARSQTLKFHDLHSSLDGEIRGTMSNLFFIDESEEDQYYQVQSKVDDDYLDEINNVPEDFNFSDNDSDTCSGKSPMFPTGLRNSFRKTRSFSEKPTGLAKEPTPTRYKLDIKNKTVTFFKNGLSRPLSEGSLHGQSIPSRAHVPPLSLRKAMSEGSLEQSAHSPLGYGSLAFGLNSLKSPEMSRTDAYGLSPIQEAISSGDASPKLVN
ncbi:AER436Cp [Eremothecium gossypii ATCC 10895]|uniref:Zinc-regulated protein 8 n=1 Tax=Eremothecium gossypii (strain ATCC 10895 / CBS 109.51 / FGSC 9923 / NRRL Y-1056) TaxID=284811 RepID=ZRG8_EREGS|nr:AER436Cp [Eremothecium gossypii ATCC 10895]Q755T2.1 RecName: Full=Zinc-regulated protein 8 [Eremothecium gossypii ATCC 10895]AAS53115.1 AER436Cp [Eremothecium gossypii ATCC 10895]AEY97424.1 FAER436Cp [Eremothecium gossypii FDAG1]